MRRKEKSKNFKRVISTLFACVFVSCAFSACTNGQTPPVKTGIEIVDDVNRTYSESDRQKAKNLVFGLVENIILTIANKNQLNEIEIERAERISEKIESVVASKNLSQTAYNQFFDNVYQNQEEYLRVIASVRKGEQNQEDIRSAKKAFTALTANVGANATGSILYDLAIFSYELEKEDALLDYEKYGYAYLLTNAEEAEKNKQILINDIKEENFISLIKLSFFMGELFFGSEMDSSVLLGFSDQEMLLLLKNPDFSAISLGKEGWKLILNGVYGNLDAKSFHKALKRKADESGDLDKLAEKLNLAIKLVCSIQNNLTESDVQFIMAGEKQKLIASCFKNFSTSDWDDFQALTSIEINNSAYDDIALYYYGNKYQTFKEQIQIVSILDLKQSVDNNDFCETLSNYLIAVCPAFYYGVNL